MLLIMIISVVSLSTCLATEKSDKLPAVLPAKMNNTIFVAENPARRSSSGENHIPLFIIRPMTSHHHHHKVKTILPPHHYKAHSSHVHGLPDYTVKDKDVVTLEKLLPMLGIYPSKIIYKNPEYAPAPAVQHIYLPVPKHPVYHTHHLHPVITHQHTPNVQHYFGKPHYIDLPHYKTSQHIHTTISGSSEIGLKHVTPYNSDPPTIYHAPTKPGSHHITEPVHIKTEHHGPKHESFVPIQHHNHHAHSPFVHQHLTPAPIVKYLTPDHFVPIHPTVPLHSHIDHKPHLHFYSAQEHSSENYHGDHGPHLGSDTDSDEHEHYHIGPTHRHTSLEQQHADSLVHQIQAKQSMVPILAKQPPYPPYQTHYKVILDKPPHPVAFDKPYDVKYHVNELGIKPPNNLLYPLPPPAFIKTDPGIKPVVEQAVEESLRRHQTTKLGENPKNLTKNHENDDDEGFKPLLKPINDTTVPQQAGTTYNAMPNKCEEKCNVETKTKDENSEMICGSNGQIYKSKTHFICAQKCGMKDLQSQPLNKCNAETTKS